MVPALMIIAAVLSGVVGLVLAPRLTRYVDHPSRWLDRRLLTGLAATAGAGGAALASGIAELITFAAIGVGAAALLVIDLAALRLPDPLVGSLYLVLMVGLGTHTVITGDWVRLLGSLACGAALMIIYFVLGLIGAGRLGLGDVKLSGLLGMLLGWLGPAQLVLGSLAAFALAGVISAILLVTARATRRSSFPFGPCMIIGAALGAWLGPDLLPFLG